MQDVIFSRLNAGKTVLVAEIGVNYYDIAKVRGMSLITQWLFFYIFLIMHKFNLFQTVFFLVVA